MHSQTADKVYVVGDILGFNGDDESSKSGNVVSKWMAMIMMMMMMMMMKSLLLARFLSLSSFHVWNREILSFRGSSEFV